MVFKVTTGLYSDSHTKHINAQCGQNVVLNLEISRVCWYAGDVRVSGLCCGIRFMYLCMYVRMDICRCWKWPPTTLLHTLFRQNWNAVTVIPNFLRNFSYSPFVFFRIATCLFWTALHAGEQTKCTSHWALHVCYRQQFDLDCVISLIQWTVQAAIVLAKCESCSWQVPAQYR